MEKVLTVFTPTYNRAHTLHKCYDSLKRQTCNNFLWLIIDDGSTDNTRMLVERWKDEGEVEIQYHFQENQGMHGAHNTAYKLINTELNVCIDSDDYMVDDAVEKLLLFWSKNKNENIAGMAALDANSHGDIIGTRFPEWVKEATLYEIYNKYGVRGDKKLIYRSELTRDYPYPVFEGEKYVSLGYKYAKIDLKYKLALFDEVVCIVEYMEDGSSKNMLKQYRANPKGFAFIRLDDMKNPNANFRFIFKSCIHYISSSLMCHNKKILKETHCKVLTLLAIPFGILLYFYIIFNTKDMNSLKSSK